MSLLELLTQDLEGVHLHWPEPAEEELSEKDQEYIRRIGELLSTYPFVFLTTLDNVTTPQIQSLRRELRGCAEIVACTNVRRIAKVGVLGT
jgi:hypothetical protein